MFFSNDAINNPPAPVTLFTVTAIKQYNACSAYELSLKENEVLHVLEEKDLFYVCYSQLTKLQGFVPKNYTQTQKPLPIIPAITKNDFITLQGVVSNEGETLVLLAKLDNEHVFFRKTTKEHQTGIITTNFLDIDGDINVLPSLEEYERRKNTNFRSGNSTPASVSRSNSKLLLQSHQQALSKEDKVIKKLKMSRSTSSSLAKSFMNLLSPPQY